MTDTILIGGLSVKARVGAYAWERLAPRPLRLDVELERDLRPAGTQGTLDQTVDYQAVADCAAELAMAQHYALVEAYAEALSRRLFERFAFERLRLTVHKPGAVAAAQTVAVRIERARSDYPVGASS